MTTTQATAAFCLLLALSATASAADDPHTEVAAIISSGSWVKELGESPYASQFVYTFAADGKYVCEHRSDAVGPPKTGKWSLAKAPDGRSILRLADQAESQHYYWLGKESFVRYDAKQDVLLIFGPTYVGDQPLRHRKAEKVAK